MTSIEVYNYEGLTVTLDESAVSVYLEGNHAITMTRDEWNAVSAALDGVEE